MASAANSVIEAYPEIGVFVAFGAFEAFQEIEPGTGRGIAAFEAYGS